MTQNNIDFLWKKYKEKTQDTLLGALGIEITEMDEKGVKGHMPVDKRTHQYYGLLHGGASVALAETLCSMGAVVHINTDTHMIVGQEINANHVRGVSSGRVYGEAKAVHLGKSSQVWEILIRNEEKKLVCISRCTIAVVPKKTPS